MLYLVFCHFLWSVKFGHLESPLSFCWAFPSQLAHLLVSVLALFLWLFPQLCIFPKLSYLVLMEAHNQAVTTPTLPARSQIQFQWALLNMDGEHLMLMYDFAFRIINHYLRVSIGWLQKRFHLEFLVSSWLQWVGLSIWLKVSLFIHTLSFKAPNVSICPWFIIYR